MIVLKCGSKVWLGIGFTVLEMFELESFNMHAIESCETVHDTVRSYGIGLLSLFMHYTRFEILYARV